MGGGGGRDGGDASGGMGGQGILDAPYLWFAGSAVNAFTKAQTVSSNNSGPRFVFVPVFSVNSFHDLAFDRVGNLWLLPITGDQIIRLPADQLTTGAPPSPDLVISGASLQGPESLAFDASGNLWVMNYKGAGVSIANIIRFDDPLAAAGTPTWTPSLTIAPGTSVDMARFSQGTAIAFDAAGSLWFVGVSNLLRFDNPGSLQGNVTASPSAILSSHDALAGLAFDASGSLWVTGAGVGYFVERIASPGAISGSTALTTAARVHLPTGTASFAGGLAFDDAGALWVALSNQLVKLGNPGSLTGDVTPTPDVTLGLSGVPDLASKLVIRPSPNGLPDY